MPLSSAERSRRYREKLKQENPELLEAQRLKNLQRIKSKKKKISEIPEEEATKRRQDWRKYKQAQRRKQKNGGQGANIVAHNSNDDSEPENMTLTAQTHLEKTNRALMKKNRFLTNKCRRFLSYNEKLKRRNWTHKKRFQRLLQLQKDEHKHDLNDIKEELMKLKAREEMLENTLRKTYQSCSKQSEKQTLKKLVENSENKRIVTKMIGLAGKVREKKKRTKRINITEITKFYMRDDVSRNTAGKKETRTKEKSKQQIRYLCDTLVNTYRKYKNEGGRYGMTTFYKNKPFFILSPRINSRNTTMCPKHSNIDYKHIALLKHKLISGTRADALEKICCNTNNYNCMYNTCQECNNKRVQFNQPEEQCDKEIQWLQFERKVHIYDKKAEGTKTEVKTIRTEKVTKKGSVDELKKIYENDLKIFKKHHFNNIHQQKQYQKAVSELKYNECLIVCDFSESYEAKLASEVQSMHFGASKRQISLHTGMVFWEKESQSFCTMSDESCHQPPGIWAHLYPVLQMIKEKTPNVEIIHFFSDGPSSQYRQKNNFYLLAHFTDTFRFRYSTWSFYEAHHGKSVADGIGESVKRNLDKKVSLGMDIVDARDAYEVSKESLKKTKVFLIPGSDFEKNSKILPAKVPALKGTMRLHQIITDENDNTKMAYRDVSCFCGDLKGQCDCFSPKYHCVISKPQQTQKNTPNAAPEETGFVPLDLQNCAMEMGINVVQQPVDIDNPIQTTAEKVVMHFEGFEEEPFYFEDIDEQAVLDMGELPIITLQEPLYDENNIIYPVQTVATKSKPTTEFYDDLATNNIPVAKNCKPEIETIKSDKNKIKILEVKTYHPKNKKIEQGNACNPANNETRLPTTERGKSEIQLGIRIPSSERGKPKIQDDPTLPSPERGNSKKIQDDPTLPSTKFGKSKIQDDRGKSKIQIDPALLSPERGKSKIQIDLRLPSPERGKSKVQEDPTPPSTKLGKSKIKIDPRLPSTERGKSKIQIDLRLPSTERGKPKIQDDPTLPSPERGKSKKIQDDPTLPSTKFGKSKIQDDRGKSKIQIDPALLSPERGQSKIQDDPTLPSPERGKSKIQDVPKLPSTGRDKSKIKIDPRLPSTERGKSKIQIDLRLPSTERGKSKIQIYPRLPSTERGESKIQTKKNVLNVINVSLPSREQR